ncbi:MAG: penicillin-binding protein 2 [Comamonadaceae bacterium]|jgi:penicillin-binding protein 2|uniref:Peptidoglycan D,D-transpeptidase MrdA n=1 Tax=Hydrogenophaga borbori TaxID=2294117 RepID=A0A372EJC5_9BURK|nr:MULTISPECIES: penicillin-binding protein 2 [Hydrogenophaga]NCT99406.1 penicillin-binding protein 2 [Comamonadaceae bacterium]RFP78638.1 penicillin-binding protein 2 [Hydrogenophaga borbori]WQB83946.1 penicillin-binding protein 2 [Hydrogenophaga sp. SNF1]
MTELRNVDADIWQFRQRVIVIALTVLFAFGLIVARMTWLQVTRHEEFMAQAESNRTAVLPVVPNRGQIVDREGRVLASNYSAYTLEITRSQIEDLDDTIAGLRELVEISPRDERRFRKLLEESHRFDSLPIRTRLSDEEVARFTAQRYRFPGVEVRARLLRHYPNGETASHVIGYIGRINQREKELIADWPEEDQANYRGTEYIGKLGAEQQHEQTLHGTTGFERVETSAGGRAVRSLAATPPTPGDTVVLTIDAKLQNLVETLYGDRRGALVAIDPRNGEVLALVSKPTFDPNLFVEGIDVDNWRALNESIDKPLLNRALRGTYPPGSTYKPFMAMAALETGARKAETAINDPGYWMLGNHRFRSHGDGGLGAVDMRRAIIKSSNVYFYSLANEMGVDAIHDFMKPLGIGQLTGIDLKGEVRGVLPSQQWKRDTYKRPEAQRWYAGETVSLGIGQGYNNFTMLQMANAMATLANGGVKRTPHLSLARRNPLTGQVEPLPTPPTENLNFKPEHVRVVLSAMQAVTTEGTSARVFSGAGYTSGGKTGTAQAVTIGQRERYDARKLEEHQRDHSLYLAFAPADEPRVALAVIVENAGFGAAAAAPIARRVFDYLLLGQYPSEQDIAALQAGGGGPPIGTPRRVSDVVWPPEVPAATAP